MCELIYYFFAGVGAAVGLYICGEVMYNQECEQKLRAARMLERRNFENPWVCHSEFPPPAYSKCSLDCTIWTTQTEQDRNMKVREE